MGKLSICKNCDIVISEYERAYGDCNYQIVCEKAYGKGVIHGGILSSSGTPEQLTALQGEIAELRAKLAELKAKNKIVYCRSCKYHENYMCLHEQWDTKRCSHYTFDDDYCSYGEAAESALSDCEREEAEKFPRINTLDAIIVTNQAVIHAKTTEELIKAQKRYDDLILGKEDGEIEK